MFKFITNIFKAPFASVDAATYDSDYFKKNNHVLIDVRTPAEFQSGHIQGAKNMPLNDFSQKLDKLPKNKPIIVVCRSGSRSGSACRMLLNAGYDNIFNLRGGTMRWRMAGKPLK